MIIKLTVSLEKLETVLSKIKLESLSNEDKKAVQEALKMVQEAQQILVIHEEKDAVRKVVAIREKILLIAAKIIYEYFTS